MNFERRMKSTEQSGAALLAVLIVSVVMVLLLGVASTTLQSRLILAQQSKQKLQDLAIVHAKKHQLIYLLATQRLTVAGVSQGVNPQGLLKNKEGYWALSVIGDELRTDGELMIEDTGLKYSIQNLSGLLSVNSRSQYWLKRWLQKKEYSVIQQAKLGDTLADYADPDNWRRPVGAELVSYKDLPFSQPANYLLQSCSEMWKVKFWDEILIQHPDFMEFCSISRNDQFNLNSVPLGLWQLFWPQSVKKIITQRLDGKWLQNSSDLLSLEPALLIDIDDYYAILGGNQFQLNVSKGAVAERFHLKQGSYTLKPFTLRLAAH
jgi:general secretion pathway protein K